MKRAKLTLRMEEALIEKAKRVAGERGTSVSGMAADFFEGLARNRPVDRLHGQIANRLRGSLKLTEGRKQSDEEDHHLRHLEEKHG